MSTAGAVVQERRSRRAHGGPWAGPATLLGVLTALVLAELVLRPTMGVLDPFNTLPVAEDGPQAPRVTIRDFSEGLATAHLTRASARLTGIADAAGAPYLLVVGDSFVAAEQVNDRETMGAQIERLSMAGGDRVNVRQYGWVAAGPAKYIAEAPELRKKWQPAMTAVVLNEDDFYSVALSDRWASMQWRPGEAPVVRRVEAGRLSRMHALAARLSGKSALFKTLYTRFSLDVWPGLYAALPRLKAKASEAANGGEGLAMEEIVRVSLMELRQAYGPRLEVIFAAEPGLEDQPDGEESAFLRECAVQKIACRSTRKAFDEARDSGAFLAAGFCNSRPAAGHYNAAGHRLIAQEIWAGYRGMESEGGQAH